MLTNFLLTLLLLATACHSTAIIPPGPRRQPVTGDRPLRDKVTIWPPQAQSEDENERRDTAAKRPGYVRMPVSRHLFNGTGKWSWGWHWAGAPGFIPGPGWGGPGGPGPGGSGGPGVVGGGGPGKGGPGGIPGGGPPGGYQPSWTGTGGFAWPTSWPSSWPTTWPTAWPTGLKPTASASRGWPGPSGGGDLPGWPPAFLPTAAAVSGASAAAVSVVSAVPTTFSTATSIAVAPRAEVGQVHPRDLAPLGMQRREQEDRRWGWSYLTDIGGIAYIIDLEIGTPAQKVKVFIDTGSYELWVNPRCNTSASESICQSHGNYYPKKSNSSLYVGGDFAVTYGTGAVKGSYWSDIMNIAMFKIPSVQFAVADDSNYTFSGILGLGYAYPYSINYPSVLNLMVSQKLISAPIFSVGLGGDGDNFSEIIFGGVNRWKFAGPLEPVPIWPPISQQDPRWIQYWINVTSVGITKPGEKAVIYTQRDNFTMPTLIDTGSTLSYIREDLVAVIGQQFQAKVDEGGNYIVDCSYRDKKGTVDFGFNRGRMVINISYRDFIFQQYPGHCMLGVQPADVGSTNYVLGDTFIRGAYLVFDQQSDVIWMNQYYNCGDAVVTVGQTARDIQYIVGAC